MAKEKIEDVSTDKLLLRRKKFFAWILSIYLIVILVFIVAILFDITQNEFDSTIVSIGGATTSQIWLPLLMIIKIKKELERRGDNQMTKKPQPRKNEVMTSSRTAEGCE